MTRFLHELRARARSRACRLVFPEGDDPRVLAAAAEIARDGLGSPVLLGDREALEAALRELGVTGGVEVIDPWSPDRVEHYADLLHDLRKGKGVTDLEAAAFVKDRLIQGALMVRDGSVDGSVAGCVRTTGDVILSGLWGVGVEEGINTVSSSFYMVMPDGSARGGEVLTFTDAGVVPEPTPVQLAEIGVAAARARSRIVGDEPRVAFLSYSTLGSADGPAIEPVREAVSHFRRLLPGCTVEGELQGDAALSRSVAVRKAPDSSIHGDANVLVFPDLNAANIAYKLVQELAGAQALGPILQGLAAPCNDLSRGASVEDIVEVACITALMSE